LIGEAKFVHTKPNQQSWHPKQLCAIFEKKVELVLFGGCLVEVKMGFEISGSCIGKFLLPFFIFKKDLFESFLSF